MQEGGTPLPPCRRLLDVTQGLRCSADGAHVVREQGFEVRLYTLDHPPPHVHVAKAGAVVKIDLSTHQAVEIVGPISDRYVKRAERLVEQKAEFLREEWEKLHGRHSSKRQGS